jgi:hypothetical protein
MSGFAEIRQQHRRVQRILSHFRLRVRTGAMTEKDVRDLS